MAPHLFHSSFCIYLYRGISYAHYVKDGRSFVMKNYWVDVNNSRRVVLVKEGEEMVAASSSDNY